MLSVHILRPSVFVVTLSNSISGLCECCRWQPSPIVMVVNCHFNNLVPPDTDGARCTKVSGPHSAGTQYPSLKYQNLACWIVLLSHAGSRESYPYTIHGTTRRTWCLGPKHPPNASLYPEVRSTMHQTKHCIMSKLPFRREFTTFTGPRRGEGRPLRYQPPEDGCSTEHMCSMSASKSRPHFKLSLEGDGIRDTRDPFETRHNTPAESCQPEYLALAHLCLYAGFV